VGRRRGIAVHPRGLADDLLVGVAGLADIVRQRTGIRPSLAWLVATLPSLLVLYLGIWCFLEWLSVAAGATAVVIALITIPMYLNARRFGDVPEPTWSLGRWASPAMLGVALVASILMAVGAIIAL
jgi:amino acid permease